MNAPQKSKVQGIMDAGGVVVPAPLFVWLLPALGLPVTPEQSAAIGTTFSWLVGVVLNALRRRRAG